MKGSKPTGDWRSFDWGSFIYSKIPKTGKIHRSTLPGYYSGEIADLQFAGLIKMEGEFLSRVPKRRKK